MTLLGQNIKKTGTRKCLFYKGAQWSATTGLEKTARREAKKSPN
jgi:hypothetical protein